MLGEASGRRLANAPKGFLGSGKCLPSAWQSLGNRLAIAWQYCGNRSVFVAIAVSGHIRYAKRRAFLIHRLLPIPARVPFFIILKRNKGRESDAAGLRSRSKLKIGLHTSRSAAHVGFRILLGPAPWLAEALDLDGVQPSCRFFDL